MDLFRWYSPMNGTFKSKMHSGIRLGHNTLLTIKLPDLRALRIMTGSLFLAVIFVAFISVRSIIAGGSSNAMYESNMDIDDGFRLLLPDLFRNLIEDGLVKKGHKGLLLSSSIHVPEKDLYFLNQHGIDFVTESDISFKMVRDETLDFVFGPSFQDCKAIDRFVKTGGIVISPRSKIPSNELQQPANYRVVHLRRFEHTMIATKKIGSTPGSMDSSTGRKLLGIPPEDKIAALKGLEDAVLEPTRKTGMPKSSKEARKMRFLPDLLNNNLEKYLRRVFISDGGNGVLEWFHKNYPSRNQEFEVYNMEIEVYDQERSQNEEPTSVGVSDWLRTNVKEDDYVVMKAEAMVIEQMLREKTINLVDELFLECKNRWEEGEDENSSKRAYWQCLELYGRLKDEGVAVHQWGS